MNTIAVTVTVRKILSLYKNLHKLIQLAFTIALIIALPSATAQQNIVERCIRSGSATTEQCGCTDRYGNPATRQCYQMVSDQTGSSVGRNGTCSPQCEGCQCYGKSSNGSVSNFGVQVPPKPPANQIKFCVGQYEGDCPSNTNWQPCPQDSHETNPVIGERLCRQRGRTLNFVGGHESNVGGHKCGYTVYTAHCN